MTDSERVHFVGVDPSFSGTGVCLMPQGGNPILRTIATSAKENHFERVDRIVDEIASLLDGKTVCLCIETPFMNPKMLNSVKMLIELGFAIRRRFYHRKIRYHDVAPSTLKKFVLGVGKGSKGQIAKGVYKRWDIDADDDNQADAAGLAKMAEAIDCIRMGRDKDKFTEGQLEAARKVMTGK